MSKAKPSAAAAVRVSAPFQVPLSALVLDENENVRSASSVTDAGIEQMASMLESAGQINPLIVSKRDDGQYVVHAGGRRTRGLWLLRDKGKIKADFAVDVRSIDQSMGIDISMIENISQESMHPVDEFQGYKRLSEKGYTPEGIAKAYGVTVLHVKRRMKLADVHPELLGLYRAGEIALDQIMALASCDDRDRQLALWQSLPEWNRSDQIIRRRLAEEEIAADDPRVALVGLDAYIKAGGGVRRDLFSEEGKGEYLTDPGLLDMLISELVAAKADELRTQSWAWVEVLECYGHEERKRFADYPKTYLPESDEQKAQRLRIETEIQTKRDQIDAIYDADEEEDDEARLDALESEIEGLERQLYALRESRIDLNGVDMLIAGAVVFLDRDEIVVRKPMVRAEDLAKLKKEEAATGERSGADRDSSDSDDSAADGVGEGLSDRLMTNLTAQRTAAVQACLVKNQAVTIAALAARMAEREFTLSYHDSAVKVSHSSQLRSLRDASPTFEESPANAVLMKEHDDLKGLLPEDASQLLAFFIEQPLDVALRVITYCTAISVDGVRGKGSGRDALAPLSAALGLDMRDWWTPTRDNYLGFVPKQKMIEAVVEAQGGPLAAEGWDKLKKAEVLDRSEDALRGTGWLPQILR